MSVIQNTFDGAEEHRQASWEPVMLVRVMLLVIAESAAGRARCGFELGPVHTTGAAALRAKIGPGEAEDDGCGGSTA